MNLLKKHHMEQVSIWYHTQFSTCLWISKSAGESILRDNALVETVVIVYVYFGLRYRSGVFDLTRNPCTWWTLPVPNCSRFNVRCLNFNSLINRWSAIPSELTRPTDQEEIFSWQRLLDLSPWGDWPKGYFNQVQTYNHWHVIWNQKPSSDSDFSRRTHGCVTNQYGSHF